MIDVLVNTQSLSKIHTRYSLGPSLLLKIVLENDIHIVKSVNLKFQWMLYTYAPCNYLLLTYSFLTSYFLKGLNKLIRHSFLLQKKKKKRAHLQVFCSVKHLMNQPFYRKPTSLPGVQTRLTLCCFQGHSPWKDFPWLKDILAGLQCTVQRALSARLFHSFAKSFPILPLSNCMFSNKQVSSNLCKLNFISS